MRTMTRRFRDYVAGTVVDPRPCGECGHATPPIVCGCLAPWCACHRAAYGHGAHTCLCTDTHACGERLSIVRSWPVWALVAILLQITVDPTLLGLAVAAATGSALGLLVRWLAGSYHAHCAACGQCSILAGVAAAWWPTHSDDNLTAAGWLVRGRTICPACQGA